MEIKGIKYVGPILDGSGYAQACRGNIRALHALGVPITLSTISFESIRPDLGEEGEFLKSLIDKKIDYNVVIIHTTPEFWHKYKEAGKTNVGYTIWETTLLHPEWIGHINNNVEKVLVGCEWNIEVFRNSGITIPIGVIPHGINPDVYADVKPYEIAGIDKDAYVFYGIFQWCYDEETRVLTKDGFKYFKDLVYEDEIATLNLKTEELEYQKPEKIVKFRRKDKMLSLKGAFFDVCVTPDHKMVVKEEPAPDWKLVPFNELITKGKSDQMIISDKYKAKKNCKWKGTEQLIFKSPVLSDKEINMDVFLEFFGWYLSEGSTYNAERGYVNTITQCKETYRKEIIDCIERMGYTAFVGGNSNKDIRFNSKDMHNYLKQFGKCNTKFIPTWIKNLSSRQIKILLNSLFKGDGTLYENGDWVKYTTTSKRLAEDVQECLLKIGMSGAISTEDPTLKTPGEIDGRLIKGKLLQYIVSVNRERNEPSMYYAELKEVDYNGFVHCATVPNHAMLVERNGKVLFSGNTERKNPLAMIKSYWYAFQNNENVALVMKTYRNDYSDGERDAIRTTLKRLKAVTPMDVYPKIYFIPNMLTDDEILGLHDRGDCYVSLDRGEGFGLCVGKNTKISVPNGIKKADAIQIDDEVLSIDGKFNKITDVSSMYVKTGLNISIKLHEDITVSEEHPLLVCSNLTGHKRRFYTSEVIESMLEWKEAKLITTDDYVVIPKPILNDTPDKIDVCSIIKDDKLREHNDTLYYDNGYSPKNTTHSYKNLVGVYGYTKKIFERAVTHIKNDTTPLDNSKTHEAYKILKDINYEIKTPNKVKRCVELNDDVLSLFGWYLAEGSTNNDTFLEIDLHKNEYNVVLELSNIFQTEFGVSNDSVLVEKYDNKSRIIVSSKVIATLFSTMFGKGARNKHIPEWLFKGGKRILPLIKSLFKGDGHNDGSTYALTTVSDSLAYQVKLFFNSIDMCARVNKKPPNELGNYSIYTVSVANNDYLSFIGEAVSTKERQFFVETNNFFIVKVTDIKTVEYNDYMFDFSVKNSKSFVGNGILLHNCPFTAGARGNPILVTGFGGTTEYAKEDNSYLVDYQLTPVFGKLMPFVAAMLRRNSFNCWKPLTSDVEGNQQRSLAKGTFND